MESGWINDRFGFFYFLLAVKLLLTTDNLFNKHNNFHQIRLTINQYGSKETIDEPSFEW